MRVSEDMVALAHSFDDPLGTALPSLADGARSALARLFDPAPVLLASAELDPSIALPHPTVQITFRSTGAFEARVAVIVDEPDAGLIAGALLRRSPALAAAGGAGEEALSEMANIVASTLLTRLAAPARLKLIPSVPMLRHAPPHDLDQDGWRIAIRFELELERPAGLLILAAPARAAAHAP